MPKEEIEEESSNEEEQEESELEEEIKEVEEEIKKEKVKDIKEEDFEEFIEQPTKSSPVLERTVDTQEPIRDLEEDIKTTPTTEKDYEEKKGVNYEINTKEDHQYTSNGDKYSLNTPDRIDMENVGRSKEKLREVDKIDMKYDTNN